MTLACQFQHLLAKPVPILPASGIDRTQPRANVATVAEAGVTGTYRERTDSPLAGFVRGTTPEVPPHLPDPVTTQPPAIAGSAAGAGFNFAWASVQLPECEYLETICDAIELADGPQDFRLIHAAIAKVRGTVNRQSLRMMVELREKEVAI